MLLERYKGHLKLYDILDDKRYYKHLAKAYHLKTDPSLKKEAFRRYLTLNIPKKLMNILACFTSQELTFLKNILLNSGIYNVNNEEYDYLDPLESLALIKVNDDDDDKVIAIIPHEIYLAFKKIDLEEINDLALQNDELDKVLKGIVNIYGIIELKDLNEMLKIYYPQINDLELFLKRLLVVYRPYSYQKISLEGERYIKTPMISIENIPLIKEIIALHAKYPRYFLPLETVLNYADPYFSEDEADYQELDRLSKSLNYNAKEVLGINETVKLYIRFDHYGIGEIVRIFMDNYLMEYGELKKYTPILYSILSNTRLFTFNGLTPLEAQNDKEDDQNIN